jgi:hypothetical protein
MKILILIGTLILQMYFLRKTVWSFK